MPIVRAFDAVIVREQMARQPSVVVIIAVSAGGEQLVHCLRSVLAGFASSVPVVVVGYDNVHGYLDGYPVEAPQDIITWRLEQPSTMAAAVNDVLRWTTQSDVVIVDDSVIVSSAWLERLRAAAYTLPNAATATTMVLDPHPLAELGAGGEKLAEAGIDKAIDTMTDRLAKMARREHFTVPKASPWCCYIRRDAVNIVGELQGASGPIGVMLDDFCLRATAVGLVHMCAPGLIAQRLPACGTAGDNDIGLETELWRVARAALRGIRVAVDGTRLASDTTGTQVVALESVKALCRHADVGELSVLVLERTTPHLLATMQKWGARIVLTRGPASETKDPGLECLHGGKADVIYRPCQVTRGAELEWLQGLARRVVVCHLDCIAYNNPAYFANWSRWSGYRRASELAFRYVDGIAFLSQTAREQAISSGLRTAGADGVVLVGTDMELMGGVPARPRRMDDTARDFFLCLGASFKHKNRVAALRILAAARAQGWGGGLVLAGPDPPEGNSLAEEDEFLRDHPYLRSTVWRLGALSDPEREWLYARAALVLYPTLSEGFGLIPFEAARRGVACLSTRSGALNEILPTDVPTMDPGDPDAAARLAVEIASDPSLARAICEALKARAGDFTWDETANRLVALFWEVMCQPSLAHDAGAELGLSASTVRASVQPRDLVLDRVIAPAVQYLVERPRLRRALVPPRSLRYRLGAAIAGSMDRRMG